MDQEKLLKQLKMNVRSLLISNKLGLDPDQLRRDYCSMLGHPMPLKQLGFRHVMDMVKEMPDVVSVNIRADGTISLKAVGAESTRNMQQLVANQRTSKVERKRSGFNAYSFANPPTPAVPPRRGRAPVAVPAQLKAQLRTLLSKGGIRLSELEASYWSSFGVPLRPHSYGFYSIGELLKAAGDLVAISQSNLGSVVTLKQNVWPRPPSTSLNPSKTMQVKQPLATRTQESSPEVDVKDQSGDPELCQKQVLKLEEELRLKIQEGGVAGSISQELKDKLREVVSQAAAGLSVHDLPTEYKRLFSEEVPLQRSGFVSVTELISAMSDTFHLKPAENDNGTYWIVTCVQESGHTASGSEEAESFDNGVHPFAGGVSSHRASDWEGSENDPAVDEESEQPEPVKHSNPRMMSFEVYPAVQVRRSSSVPLDALQNQRLRKPTPRAARQLFDILVEEVASPGNFYVCFTNSEEAQAVECMMIAMRQCYTIAEVSRRYSLPERFVRRGQACCVSPNGMWFYRVVIHQLVSHTCVTVYFVDFGNIATVQTAHLKFLKSCYSILPAQAVPSSLAGIKPAAGSWTAVATASFKKLCSHHVMVGGLDSYVGDVLQVYLCDTSTDEDIYVHTVLLSQGHGTPCTPAASAERCVLVSPVSLYLGEGMVDLPELEETSLNHSHISQEGESNDWTFSLTDLGLVLTNKSPPANPSSPASTPLGPPGLALLDAPHLAPLGPPELAPLDAPHISAMESPPSINSNSFCPLLEEKLPPAKVSAPALVKLPPLLRILSPRTSEVQVQGSPLHLQKTSVMFPLFRARWVKQSPGAECVETKGRVLLGRQNR
ncbi:tudor domain-containing protein 5 [Brachionichthys hirsutus]|uniref:tudor domain-containing protein 5 n=1 Tax=Brachionichthys hirsutus TaxID=412623 RepID=UPI0036044990